MAEPKYALDKADIAHKAISLLFAICVLGYHFMIGSGSFREKFAETCVPLFSLSLIWFPRVFSAHLPGRNNEKYSRILGWLLLAGIPLLFHALSLVVE